MEPLASIEGAGGEGMGDHKRKLEEVVTKVEADDGDSTNKPHVDGEPNNAGVQQSDEPEEKAEEEEMAAAAAVNGKVTTTVENLTKPTVEAPQHDGGAPNGV